jgi:CubicO group peptidase (beta-lactamase class C family)
MTQSADEVAQTVIEGGVAPAAAAGCARRIPKSGERATSMWVRELGGRRASYFDLASLTKPMTAMAVAKSGLDRGERVGGASIELLLAHRAGLEAHLALYEPLTRGQPIDARAAVLRAGSARRAGAEGDPPTEGFPPLYSDLGYIAAGDALARHVGARDAGEAIEALVVRPLGAERALGTARDLAAHGVDLATLAEPTELVPWRGGVVRGQVHDENAWALTGLGGSGHAGMFGTIDAVLDFGCWALGEIEKDPALGWLVRERAGGELLAGWDGKSKEASSAGVRMSARAFGHLGFTGTSLWIDPEASVVVALLTNRVHPTRENTRIRAARPVAHDALFARALALS